MLSLSREDGETSRFPDCGIQRCYLPFGHMQLAVAGEDKGQGFSALASTMLMTMCNASEGMKAFL